MAKTIQDLLGYTSLSGISEAVKTGVPDVLPDAFWTTKSRTVGDAGEYTRYEGTRQTMKRTEYGASSTKRALSAIGKFPVKLMHFYEHIDLDIKVYQALRKYADYGMQEMGRVEVERQVAQFRAVMDNTRKSLVCSMLSEGSISFDSSGNLLPSTSGAALTIDYAVPANNQNQLNGVIAASWATTTTNIPNHLRALRKRARQDTGYPLKYAFYGQNIPGYFAANDFVKEYLSRHPVMRQQFLDNGEIPNGLFGFDWVPVYEAFFVDQSGTVQEWFGSDQVTFTPDINSDVYEMIEGTFPVPRSFQPFVDHKAATADFDIKEGMFAYGVPISDPMTARLFHGDTCLPVWKNPSAIYLADVTP
jgi:hypothetical protein